MFKTTFSGNNKISEGTKKFRGHCTPWPWPCLNAVKKWSFLLFVFYYWNKKKKMRAKRATLTQAHNQLGTPGRVKSFLRA